MLLVIRKAIVLISLTQFDGYDIYMTVQYALRSQQLTLTNPADSIRWRMLGADAFDEGKLEAAIHGRKGEYPQKPLLRF
jgi:hypothetical protein